MSTTRLITPQSLTNLQIKPCSKSETFICSSSPGFRLVISKQNDRSCFANDGGLRYRSGGRGLRRGRNGSMDLVVYSDVQPGGAPLPSDPSSNSCRKGWILGALITIMLPFLRNKWGPLFKLTKDVEAVAERAEHVTKVVEEVAEEVDKVAKEVADELPKGGKLEKAIESVENAAEKADKAAHLADDLIDKVEEVDKEVESLMEPVNDQAKETAAKEASDQK
ncbi:uncharacterized protein LOC131333976 isoform X2 [Rhododendron vialii]|uniref:uncharacterized protein LOC131333976 isoform X2 n=1 Tax=Rhododendron vialii TaxID=182163 RepID=UPI00265F7451|nr:uncharacterized protein LOC131333976 isoform X2 [Rhododendron vialii]